MSMPVSVVNALTLSRFAQPRSIAVRALVTTLQPLDHTVRDAQPAEQGSRPRMLGDASGDFPVGRGGYRFVTTLSRSDPSGSTPTAAPAGISRSGTVAQREAPCCADGRRPSSAAPGKGSAIGSWPVRRAGSESRETSACDQTPTQTYLSPGRSMGSSLSRLPAGS